MMVIRSGTNGNIFPADRCTWAQSAQAAGDSNYSIENAVFYPGASVNNVLGITTAATHIPIGEPELGYIGKSGRFVGMTV